MAKKEEAIAVGQSKYSDDGPFNDPVVRCNGCSKIVQMTDIKRIGCCPLCGNTRVKKLRTFSKEEWEQMIKWGIDRDFLSIFADIESKMPGDNF